MPTGFIYKASFGSVYLQVLQEAPAPCVQACDELQKERWGSNGGLRRKPSEDTLVIPTPTPHQADFPPRRMK